MICVHTHQSQNKPFYLCVVGLCISMFANDWNISSVSVVARLRRMAWCLDTHGFILRKTQWHIHAGLWSLVNWWREALTRHYIRCSWILMTSAVGLMDGLGLDGNRCPHDTPTSPFSVKEEALPACKETITRNIQWSLKDQVMQQVWMYYKEKLMKNLADLNTFETSMSLRDHVTLKMNLNPLSIYICTHCPQVAQRC